MCPQISSQLHLCRGHAFLERSLHPVAHQRAERPSHLKPAAKGHSKFRALPVSLLPVPVVSLHGNLEKHSEDQCVGDCGVARFIRIKIEGCPWISNVSSLSILPQKKTNLVFIKTKTKASVQCPCFILKLGPSEPMWSVEALVAARPPWLRWREPARERAELIFPGKREKVLCSLGLQYLRLGKDQELFQDNQSTSQAFTGCTCLPSNIFFLQAGVTGLHGWHSGSDCTCLITASPWTTLTSTAHVLSSPSLFYSLSSDL